MFVKQMRRLNTDLDDLEVAKVMSFDSTDDFFAALGGGVITISDVVNKLSTQEVTPQQDNLVALPATGPASGIQVLGVGDLLTRMAPCCNPISGDDIMGYITRNRGVTVHREECPNIVNEQEKERLVKVTWGEAQTLYPVRITIEAWGQGRPAQGRYGAGLRGEGQHCLLRIRGGRRYQRHIADGVH